MPVTYREVSYSWKPSSLKLKISSTICCVSVPSLSTSSTASCFSAGSCGDCCANSPQGTNRAVTKKHNAQSFFISFSRKQNERAYYIGCCEMGKERIPYLYD